MIHKKGNTMVYSILIGFCVVSLIYLLSQFINCSRDSSEGFQATDLQTPATLYPLCFLCVAPSKEYLETLVPFTNTQPVYVLCDKNDYRAPESTMYKTIRITEMDTIQTHTVSSGVLYIVQIQDEVCGEHGFINAASTIPKKPSAWDKALYYFCLKNSTNHVWFVEEDVFFPRYNIFDEINRRYPNTDFVTKQHVSEKEDPDFYWWFDAEGKMERPYYRSLVCTARISRNIMNEITKIASEKRTICFVETLFSTIVHHKKFTLELAPELQSVIFRHDWTKETVHMNGLFHPVKDVKDQIAFRMHLEGSATKV